MRKTATAALIVCAIVFSASIVSPAVGGPSIGSLAKTANKALKTGKSANRTAKSARALARTANAKADQALGQAGLVRTTTVRQEVAALPGTFAEFDLSCPAGYAPTGHGLGNGALAPVFVGPVPDGYIASLSNLAGSSTYSGYLYVICARGAWSATASSTMSRSTAFRAMRQAEESFRQSAGTAETP